jgi:hypothetical protein
LLLNQTTPPFLCGYHETKLYGKKVFKKTIFLRKVDRNLARCNQK